VWAIIDRTSAAAKKNPPERGVSFEVEKPDHSCAAFTAQGGRAWIGKLTAAVAGPGDRVSVQATTPG